MVLPGTNTPAYFIRVFVRKSNSLIKLTPGLELAVGAPPTFGHAFQGGQFNFNLNLRDKKLHHTRVGQKSRKEIYFLETDRFWPRAIPQRVADLRPRPKNYMYGVGMFLKIMIHSFHQKLFNFFLCTADTQTDTHPPIQKNDVFLNTIHFTTLIKEYLNALNGSSNLKHFKGQCCKTFCP
jgi:hypothetical protein